MKSWLVRFLGIRKKSLHPFISRWGSRRLRFERHSHDLVQVSIPQRPTVPIDVQFVSSFRHGGTPPLVRLVFFTLPPKPNPPVEAKKQGVTSRPAFREDAEGFSSKCPIGKFWWETEKFHRSEIPRPTRQLRAVLIDDYPTGIIGWVRNHVDRISPGKSFF